MRRSISGGSSNRKSQARAFNTRVSAATLCPLGQSNKAIGPESPIGPCIATPRVDNRPACCFRKRWRRHKQRNGTTGENNRISVSHTETKQNPFPGEDHSQTKRLRSNSWAECRHKKGPASSRRGNICLDISFYRTYRLPRSQDFGYNFRIAENPIRT